MIELDDDHRYTVDGHPVPGVTQILSGLNLVDDQWFTEQSRQRGTAVHAAVHYWIQDDLKWETLDPRIEGYVRAAIRFLEDARADPKQLRTEVRVFNSVLGYCGTTDVLGVVFGDDAVTDWKSGALGKATGLQTAAYDLADPGHRRRRIGVQLRNNGTYKKVDLDRELDPSGTDYRRFPAAVDLYRRFVWPRELQERSIHASA